MSARLPELLVAALLASLLATPAPRAEAQSWQELGPAPISSGPFAGRISSLAVSPTRGGRYFAGAADGGVWRTKNGGKDWKPLTDFMPTTAIGALALDPADENVIFAGTGEANYANHSRYGLGIYKSTDGGNSWIQLAEDVFGGRCFSRIIVSHADSQVIYASITRAGGFPELAAAKGHPGATSDLGVFKSSDGGVSWARLTNLPNLSTTDLAMDPANASVLYAAVGRIFGHSSNGIYKSTDAGATWNKLTSGLPSSNVGRISVAVAPSDSSRLYALVTNECSSTGGGASTIGSYRSTNAGASWTRVSSSNLQASYGWYLSTVLVHPTDRDIVFMGGLSLRRSTNGGSSWSEVTPPHVDLHALAFDARGRLLAGDDGGVHRSSNLGNSWESLNDGLGTVQFYAGISTHPGDENVVLAGAQDNGSNRRTSDSKTWSHVFGGDGGFTAIDQAAPNRSFVEYQGTGNLYRSTGGSYNWVGSGIGGRNCFLPPFLIDPTDSSRMYYGSHQLYRSTNGGSNWSAISGDLSNGSGAIRALAMGTSDPLVIYAATNDGNVLVSQNGGANFSQILAGHPGWPRVTRELWVDPTDAQVVYLATAVFGTTQIRRSRDAGQTFAALDLQFPDLPVNVLAVDPRAQPPVIYAGTDAGVFHSWDDGGSWQRTGVGLPHVPVIDLRLEPERSRLVVGTQGRGAWSLKVLPAQDRGRQTAR